MNLLNGDSSLKLHIREYIPDDLEACLSIFASNLDALPDQKDDFSQFLENGTSWFLVVEVNDKVVACGGVEINGDSNASHLCYGMVERGYQKQGIGSVLTLSRLLLAPMDEPPALVTMETTVATEPFYARFGFERMVPREKRRHDFANYVDLGMWLSAERQEEIRSTLALLPVTYVEGILVPVE